MPNGPRKAHEGLRASQTCNIALEAAPHSLRGPRAGGRERVGEAYSSIDTLTAYYDTHREKLLGYADAFVRNDSVAEDVVQQAFLNTMQALEQGTTIISLPAWMHRCVRNLAIQHLQRHPVETLHEAIEARGPKTPFDELHVRERWHAVEEAVDRLPDHFREAFLLAELRGLSYREIATAMDRSVNSVRQMLRRARQHVRDLAGPDSVPLLWPVTHLDALQREAGPLAQALESRFGGKLRDLHNWLNLLAGRVAEPLAAPVTSLMAAAAVVTVAAGLHPFSWPFAATQRDATSPDASTLATDTDHTTTGSLPHRNAQAPYGRNTGPNETGADARGVGSPGPSRGAGASAGASAGTAQAAWQVVPESSMAFSPGPFAGTGSSMISPSTMFAGTGGWLMPVGGQFWTEPIGSNLAAPSLNRSAGRLHSTSPAFRRSAGGTPRPTGAAGSLRPTLRSTVNPTPASGNRPARGRAAQPAHPARRGPGPTPAGRPRPAPGGDHSPGGTPPPAPSSPPGHAPPAVEDSSPPQLQEPPPPLQKPSPPRPQ